MKLKYKLSGSFVEEILKISGGYLERRELDLFFDTLEKESGKYLFTKSSENNLLRVINSFFDRAMFLKDSVKYPHYLEILSTISSNSSYLCDILVHDPEFFYWIVNPSNLNAVQSVEEIKKNADSLTSRYRAFNSKLNALKSFKRKEILRIGLRDLLGISTLLQVTEQLSLLASAVLDNLFRLCIAGVENKYNVKLKSSYCLIALGKLGGAELNYSSDADLIIFYDNDKKYGQKYYSEYLTEAIKLFIESSSRTTETGYLYRIDFRLRPDGRNSALCRSIHEYFSYYESKGEQWERQMLIKSGFVSGSFSLYKKFVSYLAPFIYPSSGFESPAEQISRIKSEIEKNLKNEFNIKLTKGGIRDIEFIVQMLQLLHGGKIKNIRIANTLKAIAELQRNKLISVSEKDILTDAYIFFRKTEHYLQLMNDRQTHTIPRAGEVVDKMACFLGFKDRLSFLSYLNNKRKAVRDIYNSFIPGDEKGNQLPLIFNNVRQAMKDIDYLRRGIDITGEKIFDQGTKNAFIAIEPSFYKILNASADSDLLLKNFTSIIRNTSFPSIWYQQLRDELFLNYLADTCIFSKKAVQLLSSEPLLQDFFISRRVFTDYGITELHSFPQKKFLFYLYVNFAVKRFRSFDISRLLSGFYTSAVKNIIIKSLGTENYFAAALGSFGSSEMTFSSDLDLIFVSGTYSKEMEKKIRNILEEINNQLNLIKVDFRLRPEGEGSQLVWDLPSYQKYLETRARVWELQSYCRLRFISGDRKMFNRFVSSIAKRIAIENYDEVKKSMAEMRRKQANILEYSRKFYFKRSPGGITDIEFILQYLILCTPGLFKKSIGKNTQEIIEVLGNSVYKELNEGSIFLKELELFIQNAYDIDRAYYPEEAERKKIMSVFFGINERELDDLFRQKISLTNSLFNKYLT